MFNNKLKFIFIILLILFVINNVSASSSSFINSLNEKNNSFQKSINNEKGTLNFNIIQLFQDFYAKIILIFKNNKITGNAIAGNAITGKVVNPNNPAGKIYQCIDNGDGTESIYEDSKLIKNCGECQTCIPDDTSNTCINEGICNMGDCSGYVSDTFLCCHPDFVMEGISCIFPTNILTSSFSNPNCPLCNKINIPTEYQCSSGKCISEDVTIKSCNEDTIVSNSVFNKVSVSMAVNINTVSDRLKGLLNQLGDLLKRNECKRITDKIAEVYNIGYGNPPSANTIREGIIERASLSINSRLYCDSIVAFNPTNPSDSAEGQLKAIIDSYINFPTDPNRPTKSQYYRAAHLLSQFYFMNLKNNDYESAGPEVIKNIISEIEKYLKISLDSSNDLGVPELKSLVYSELADLEFTKAMYYMKNPASYSDYIAGFQWSLYNQQMAVNSATNTEKAKFYQNNLIDKKKTILQMMISNLDKSILEGKDFIKNNFPEDINQYIGDWTQQDIDNFMLPKISNDYVPTVVNIASLQMRNYLRRLDYWVHKGPMARSLNNAIFGTLTKDSTNDILTQKLNIILSYREGFETFQMFLNSSQDINKYCNSIIDLDKLKMIRDAFMSIDSDIGNMDDNDLSDCLSNYITNDRKLESLSGACYDIISKKCNTDTSCSFSDIKLLRQNGNNDEISESIYIRYTGTYIYGGASAYFNDNAQLKINNFKFLNCLSDNKYCWGEISPNSFTKRVPIPTSQTDLVIDTNTYPYNPFTVEEIKNMEHSLNDVSIIKYSATAVEYMFYASIGIRLIAKPTIATVINIFQSTAKYMIIMQGVDTGLKSIDPSGGEVASDMINIFYAGYLTWAHTTVETKTRLVNNNGKIEAYKSFADDNARAKFTTETSAVATGNPNEYTVTFADGKPYTVRTILDNQPILVGSEIPEAKDLLDQIYRETQKVSDDLHDYCRQCNDKCCPFGDSGACGGLSLDNVDLSNLGKFLNDVSSALDTMKSYKNNPPSVSKDSYNAAITQILNHELIVDLLKKVSKSSSQSFSQCMAYDPYIEAMGLAAEYIIKDPTSGGWNGDNNNLMCGLTTFLKEGMNKYFTNAGTSWLSLDQKLKTKKCDEFNRYDTKASDTKNVEDEAIKKEEGIKDFIEKLSTSDAQKLLDTFGGNLEGWVQVGGGEVNGFNDGQIFILQNSITKKLGFIVKGGGQGANAFNGLDFVFFDNNQNMVLVKKNGKYGTFSIERWYKNGLNSQGSKYIQYGPKYLTDAYYNTNGELWVRKKSSGACGEYFQPNILADDLSKKVVIFEMDGKIFGHKPGNKNYAEFRTVYQSWNMGTTFRNRDANNLVFIDVSYSGPFSYQKYDITPIFYTDLYIDNNKLFKKRIFVYLDPTLNPDTNLPFNTPMVYSEGLKRKHITYFSSTQINDKGKLYSRLFNFDSKNPKVLVYNNPPNDIAYTVKAKIYDKSENEVLFKDTDKKWYIMWPMEVLGKPPRNAPEFLDHGIPAKISVKEYNPEIHGKVFTDGSKKWVWTADPNYPNDISKGNFKDSVTGLMLR